MVTKIITLVDDITGDVLLPRTRTDAITMPNGNSLNTFLEGFGSTEPPLEEILELVVGSGVDEFPTIQEAIDSLPKVLNSLARITIREGVYPEDVVIKGFNGYGYLSLDTEFIQEGETWRPAMVDVGTVSIYNCNLTELSLGYLTLNLSLSDNFIEQLDSYGGYEPYIYNSGVTVKNSSNVSLNISVIPCNQVGTSLSIDGVNIVNSLNISVSIDMDGTGYLENNFLRGVVAENSSVTLSSGNISNVHYGVYLYFSYIYIDYTDFYTISYSPVSSDDNASIININGDNYNVDGVPSSVVASCIVLVNGKSYKKTITTILPTTIGATGWQAEATGGLYKYRLTTPSNMDNFKFTFDLDLSDITSADTINTIEKSWSHIKKISIDAIYVYFYADAVPTIEIPVKGVGI